MLFTCRMMSSATFSCKNRIQQATKIIKLHCPVKRCQCYATQIENATQQDGGNTDEKCGDIKDCIASDLHYNKNYEQQSDGTKQQLYPGHIPTTVLQKTLLAVGSSLTSILDPYRHDMVAVLGEVTGDMALQRLHARMKADAEGSEILRDRPRIHSSTIDLPYLQTLPEDSLGGVYSKFLIDNKVTPDSRDPVQFVDDPQLAYVMQRYREVHDVVHAVLAMPTNMVGEVAVKWVEAIQTGLPMCYMGAVFGPVRFANKQRQKYLQSHLPWAIRTGYNGKLLLNVYYEKRWQQNIHQLRRELNIEPMPQI